MSALARTHDLARALLARRNEVIRTWGVGRLWVVWDTHRPVPAPVPTADLIPTQQPGELESADAPGGDS